MSTFQIGDIVIGNNSWLIGMIGASSQFGVITHTNEHSSEIYLFITDETITLLNGYIDKLDMGDKIKLKIGDLVELKPKIKNILTINGVGTIVSETVINTTDLDGSWTEEFIDAFLVYFAQDDYKYTIPKSCLQLFYKDKKD